jgi:hypothetical protein
MDWPKLPDGTIDWMTVFQAPETGLIAQIEQATTSAKLKACFSFIIKVLFSRDSDAEIRETFLKTSEDLFGDEPNDADLDALKVKLRMIMMRLMNERIQRSLSHVAIQSGKGSAEDEARLAGDNPLAALEGA